MCLVLPMTLWLTACKPGNSDVAVKIVCPQIKQYDSSLLNRALAEYRALPATSAIKEMIGDYKHLRDQIRACSK